MKRFPDYGRPAKRRRDRGEFGAQLRSDLLGRLHSGLLRPGEKLPSIRDVADRTGVDHRIVAKAYRSLEEQGLISIRHNAGVFVAPGKVAEGSEDERTAWAAEVLFRSWERGMSRSLLFGLLGGNVAATLRCGCIESNEDHMLALCAEVEEGFSVEAVPLMVDAGAGAESPPPEGIGEVELLVTSVFHNAHARAVAERAGVPLVVLSLGKEYTAEVGRRAEEGPITTVFVDPRYVERARAYLSPWLRGQVRFVGVEEAEREGVQLESERVMATRAARRRLGLEEYHLIPTPASFLSRESAAELCAAIARVAAARRPE